MSIEAMKQALDCLQAAYNLQQIDDLIPPHAPVKQAVASLRQAIEQAEKQEPVAWITDHGKGWLRWHSESDSEKNKTSISLYATPQPQREWVGLTDEEIKRAPHHMVDGAYHYSFKQGAEWAEAKLREKNGGGR